jgi:hypothetical protein
MICVTVFYIYNTDSNTDRALLMVMYGHEYVYP